MESSYVTYNTKNPSRLREGTCLGVNTTQDQNDRVQPVRESRTACDPSARKTGLLENLGSVLGEGISACPGRVDNAVWRSGMFEEGGAIPKVKRHTGTVEEEKQLAALLAKIQMSDTSMQRTPNDMVQGVVFLGKYKHDWLGGLPSQLVTIKHPSTQSGYLRVSYYCKNTRGNHKHRIHVLCTNTEVAAFDVDEDASNLNIVTYSQTILNIARTHQFMIIISHPVDDYSFSLSLELCPAQNTKIESNIKKPEILSMPPVHRVQYLAISTGPPHMPVWECRTVIDGQEAIFKASHLKAAKTQLQEFVRALYPTAVFYENLSYSEYKANVHNKEMHTINGNINEVLATEKQSYHYQRFLFYKHVLRPRIATDSQTKLTGTTLYPIGYVTNNVNGTISPSTITALNLAVPEGTPMLLTVSTNLHTDVPGGSVAYPEYVVNGNVHTGSEMTADTPEESPTTSMQIPFFSEAVNFIETVWQEVSGIGSWFSNLLSVQQNPVPAEAFVFKYYEVPFSVFCVKKDLYVPVSIALLRCEKGFKTFKAARDYVYRYHRGSRRLPVLIHMSYDRFLQVTRNAMVHALLGNTDMTDAELADIINGFPTEFGVPAPNPRITTTAESEKKTAYVVAKDIPATDKAIKSVIDKTVHVSKVIKDVPPDDLEDILSVLEKLQAGTDLSVMVVACGIVTILDYYLVDIAPDRIKKIRILLDKHRARDKDVPAEEFSSALASIEQSLIGQGKAKQPARPRPPGPPGDKGDPVTSVRPTPVEKEQQIRSKEQSIEEARANFTNALNRHVSVFTKDQYALFPWMMRTKSSLGYQAQVCDRLFGFMWQETLTATKPAQVLAYMWLNGINLVLAMPYLMHRYNGKEYNTSLHTLYVSVLHTDPVPSTYLEELAKKHNKLMHILNGNTTPQIIDASPTYQEVKAKTKECKTAPHLKGYIFAERICSLVTGANREVTDYTVADWLIAPIQNSNFTTTESSIIRMPLSFVQPRHTRDEEGVNENTAQDLFFTAVTTKTPPPYEMGWTTQGNYIWNIINKNNFTTGRLDNATFGGYNFIDLSMIVRTDPAVPLVMDQAIFKLMLLNHCLITKEIVNSIPAGNWNFYEPYSSLIHPLSDNFNNYDININGPNNETLGGANSVYPFKCSTPAGALAFHLSRSTVPLQYHSQCIYVPVHLLNMGGAVASKNLLLLMVMFAPWPFCFFNNEYTTVNVDGEAAAQAASTNRASLVYVPGIEPLHIVLPREGGGSNPPTQDAANARLLFRPVFGSTATTGYDPDEPINVNYDPKENTIEYPLAQYFYSWFKSAAITPGDILNFLEKLAAYVDVADTTRAMYDLMLYHVYTTGPSLLTPRGNVTVLNRLPPRSFIMQQPLMLDGRELDQATGDWPLDKPRHYYSWIHTTDPTGWNPVAVGARLACNIPNRRIDFYRYIDHINYFLDSQYNAMLLSMIFQYNFAAAGVCTDAWNRSLSSSTKVPKSVRKWCLSYYSLVRGPELSSVTVNQYGQYFYSLCALLFGCAPQALKYCKSDASVNLFSRILFNSTSQRWSGVYDAEVGLMDLSFPPTWMAEVWFAIFASIMPKNIIPRPIMSNQDGWWGFKGAELTAINTPGFFSVYIDSKLGEFFSADDYSVKRFSDKSTFNQRIARYDGADARTRNGTVTTPAVPSALFPTQRLDNIFYLTEVVSNINAYTVSEVLMNTATIPLIDSNGSYIHYFVETSGAVNLLRRYMERSNWVHTSSWLLDTTKVPGELVSDPSGAVPSPDDDVRDDNQNSMDPGGGPKPTHVVEPPPMPASTPKLDMDFLEPVGAPTAKKEVS